jgi:hypothetical protein
MGFLNKDFLVFLRALCALSGEIFSPGYRVRKL